MSDDEDWDKDFVDEGSPVLARAKLTLNQTNTTTTEKSTSSPSSSPSLPSPFGKSNPFLKDTAKPNEEKDKKTTTNVPSTPPTTPNPIDSPSMGAMAALRRNSAFGGSNRNLFSAGNGNNNSKPAMKVAAIAEDEDENWDDFGTSSESNSVKGMTKSQSTSSESSWDADSSSTSSPASLLFLKKKLAGSLSNSSPSASPSIKGRPAFEEDEEDWTSDFATEIEDSKPLLKITGIKADPKQKEEDWDEDFDFSTTDNSTNDSKGGNETSKSLFTLNRSKSNMIMPNVLKVHSILKETIQAFPGGSSKTRKTSNNRTKSITESPSWEKVKEANLPTLPNSPSAKSQKPWLSNSIGNNPASRIAEAKVLYQSAMENLNKNNPLESLKQLKSAQSLVIAIPMKEKDANFESELHYQTGLLSKGEPMDAVSHFKLAIDVLGLQDLEANLPFKSKVNHELGTCYIALSNHSSAATSFAESLKCSFGINFTEIDWSLVAHNCLSIVNCSEEMNLSRELAFAYAKKAEEAACLGNDKKGAEMASECAKRLERFETPEQKNLTPSKSGPVPLVVPAISSNSQLKPEDDSAGSDSEDWDIELGLDGQRQTLTLAAPGGGINKLAADPEERIPKRYKLLDSIRGDVEILRFPKSTFFYTMKTPEGHRLLNEEALEEWLRMIVNKHQNPFHESIKTNSKTELQRKQQFISRLQRTPKLSLDWAKEHLEYCTSFYRLNQLETCWDTLFGFFVDLSDCNLSKMTEKDQHEFTHLVLMMAYLASKMWRPEEDTQFQGILKRIEGFNPKCSLLCQVIQVETMVHHKYSNDSNFDQAFVLNSLRTLSKIFKQLEAKKSQGDNGKASSEMNFHLQSLNECSDNLIQSRILCDIHFLLNDISPLTCLNRDYSEDEEKADSDSRKGMSQGAMETFLTENNDLLDSNIRMKTLTELYPLLPTGFQKAKAAYALALYQHYESDNQAVAEQLYFECLYILDICQYSVEGLPPILSELGSNALLHYGEVLLSNFKYQYAIVSYESAVKSYRVRQKGYYPLLRKIATITKENDDYKRSIEYHKEILDGYYNEGKNNEIRYVSEVISQLYLDLGDFRKAESFLRNALDATAPTPSTSFVGLPAGMPIDNNKVDNTSFKLHLKLVDLYLSSYHYEKGIEHMENLMTMNLPNGSNPIVLSRLAKAYIKKRWFREASVVLLRLKEETANNKTATSGFFANSENFTLKYFELMALNFHHAGRSQEALSCIDTALSMCPTHSLASLARYWSTRAKIFRELCSCTTLVFPTTLRPQVSDSSNLSPASVGPSNPNRMSGAVGGSKLYTCTGDLIQECISSYDKAYHYYKGIGDDIHIAKTVNGIVQTYLERLFAPVALLHFPYNDLARLPAFEQLELAKAASASSSKHKRTKSSVPSDPSPTPSPSTSKDFYISFEKIENPALCGLDISAETFDPLLISQSFMNMAELKYLQGETETAIAFWNECKELIVNIFMDGQTLLGKGSPPPIIGKIFKTFQRITRFLFCYDSEFINQNLNVIDAYLLLQYDLESSYRRPTRPKANTIQKEDEFMSHLESHPDLITKTSSPVPYSSKPKKVPSMGAGLNANSAMAGTFSMTKSASIATTKKTANAIEESSTFGDRQRRKSMSISENNPLSKLSQINNESGERIWGYLYAIKTEIKSFIKGKLAQEELLSRNRNSLKKILQVKRANEIMKQQNTEQILTHNASQESKETAPVGSNSSHPSFQQLLDENPRLAKLMYVLSIKDYLIYYVPVTGSIRIQQLGGKEEDDARTLMGLNNAQLRAISIHIMPSPEESVMLLVPPSLPLDKLLKHLCNKPYWEAEDMRKKSFFGSFGRSGGVQVKKIKFVERGKEEDDARTLMGLNNAQLRAISIHIMPSPEESVMLLVPPSLPLDKLLKHLCNKPYWEAEDMRKKSFFGSFGRSGGVQVKKIKFVERTKGFHANLYDILSQIAITDPNNDSVAGRVWTTQDLSRVAFAKKSVNQIDSSVTYTPLNVSSSRTVQQCFSQQETKECSPDNPLRLFIYFSSGESGSNEIDSSQRDYLNKTVFLSNAMLDYFGSIVEDDETEYTDAKKTVADITEAFVSTLTDIIPYDYGDKDHPIILIMSKVMSLLPWELMLQDAPVARFVSLQDLNSHHHMRGLLRKNTEILPKYFSLHSSTSDKTSLSHESDRRKWILQSLLSDLNVKQKIPSCNRLSQEVVPFHSPLIKYGKRVSAYKRQYKFIHWTDTVPINHPWEIVRLFKNVDLSPPSVMLLTYADLLEFNETLQYIVRTRPECTFLFIPSSKMKLVVTKLMKVQEDMLKPKAKSQFNDPQQFLNATIASIQQELSIPITVMNPMI
eukprot:TRINITY_DN4720_c0_g1_i1.p1 TRINITY_DN4720_c0_g1~~TRINITY_DN4720_c0_g1_i1.p1  ORF type:complete len:2345 (+),score=886.19 TRINITY_DN4720_c0_g1_i1:144-7178(+)